MSATRTAAQPRAVKLMILARFVAGVRSPRGITELFELTDRLGHRRLGHAFPMRLALQHFVALAVLLAAAELAIGLGVVSGTLLRGAASAGLCLMIVYTIAGYGGASGDFAGACLAIVCLGGAAGLLGVDGALVRGAGS